MSDIVNIIVESLETDSRISAAFLLGSAATDRMRRGSDIDIALLPASGCRIDDLDRMTLTAELSQKIGLPVDLGLLSSRNLVYAREAILTGREIFCRDRKYADLMTTSLLGMYLRFQEDRREVLDAYRAG